MELDKTIYDQIRVGQRYKISVPKEWPDQPDGAALSDFREVWVTVIKKLGAGQAPYGAVNIGAPPHPPDTPLPEVRLEYWVRVRTDDNKEGDVNVLSFFNCTRDKECCQ